MTTPPLDLTRFGHLATRSQLRELGHTNHVLRRAVANKQLWPVRQSWVAAVGADHRALRAVGLGGRLAASSALASYGIWVTRPSGLWVASKPNAGRLPAPKANERRLWVPERFPQTSDKRWRMSVQDSLLQTLTVDDEKDAIAACDSALNKGLVSRTGIEEIFDAAPRRVRRLLKRIDAGADSGLETLLRLAAEAEGWNVEVQVFIDGVGHVDVLIDGWLVIELDGRQWHDSEDSQDEDSRRDAQLIVRGYRRHRFRYEQILNQMPLCLAVIRTLLADGRPLAVGA